MFLQRTLYVLIFTWINDFKLVLNHGGCLSSHTINSWGIRWGRMNFKIKFCVWWHFRCSEGWVLESAIKLSWDVKSIHEDEFSRIWVGYFIICCNLNWDAIFSTKIPSKVLVSWLYQCLSFAWKSAITASKDELFSDNFFKVYSKFYENDKTSFRVWRGNL